ncbi:MAG: glycosyltransferase family 4 protein [Actinomycetia bacterium]|nr:glycosyltransferase family 4 protein [Actinomycetes bacterium]
MAEQLAVLLGRDAPPIHVIPHGELASVYRRFAPTGPDPRQPHDILFYGRRFAYKGLDVLIEAMDQVVARVPTARLVIAGRGSPLPWSPDDAPGWVEIHDGFVDDVTTAALFDRCGVVALPYREASQSGVLALALGVGRALVASDVGGLSELIEHDRTGLLVPPGDPQQLAQALIRVLDDPALMTTMATDQRELAQTTLSWDTIAEQTEAIYRTVL